MILASLFGLAQSFSSQSGPKPRERWSSAGRETRFGLQWLKEVTSEAYGFGAFIVTLEER